jgi:hypothetical protein
MASSPSGIDWFHLARSYTTEEKIFSLFWAVCILVIGIFSPGEWIRSSIA